MPDIDGLDTKPWLRMPGESARAHHAFSHYLNLPVWESSLSKAYYAHKVECLKQDAPPKTYWASPQWQDWRFRHNWPARVAAHDAEIAERTRLQKVQAIETMNINHADLAGRVQQLVLKRLQQMVDEHIIPEMSPLALAKVLDLASTVERRARNLPTVITQGTVQTSEVPLDLSGLSDAELEVVEKLMNKAKAAGSPVLLDTP